MAESLERVIHKVGTMVPFVTSSTALSESLTTSSFSSEPDLIFVATLDSANHLVSVTRVDFGSRLLGDQLGACGVHVAVSGRGQ